VRILISILLLIGWSGHAATNLIENSSFEAGDLHGWSFGGATWQPKLPFAPTNNVAYHGAKSVRFEHSITNGPNGIVSRFYRLKTNELHTFSVWAKGDAGGTVANNIHVQIVNADAIRLGQAADTYSTNWTITTSWVRYEMTFRTHTNAAACVYYVWIYDHWNSNGGATNEFLSIDAVQLEEGSGATTYAPLSPIEVGANLLRDVPGHVFISTNTVTLQFVSYNDTASSSNITEKFEIRDLWNTVQTNGSFAVTAPPGAATNSLTLTTLPLGWFRTTYWREGVDGSINDLSFSRVLPPVTLSHRTNSFLGCHLPNIPWFLAAAQRAGFHWNRLMSVENQGYWVDVEPTVSSGINVYTQSVALNRVYDIEPLMVIGAKDGRPEPLDAFGQHVPNVPNWSTNSVDRWPETNYWFRFAVAIASNYSNWCGYFELFNEQVNTNQFTNILTWAHAGLKLGNNKASVVAPVDFYALIANQMLSKITGGSNLVDIWSTHLYANDDATMTYQRTNMAANGFAPGARHAWQTEAGLRTESATRANFWEELFQVSTLCPDSTGNQRDGRYRTVLISHMLFGGLRDAIKVWFYYEGRATGGFDQNIAFSIFDHDQTLRPHGVMLAAAAQRIETAESRGRLYIDTPSNRVDAFWFDRSGTAVAVMWPTNIDDVPTILGGDGSGVAGNGKKLRLLSTLATNQFQVYDMFGNGIPYSNGVRFGMDPIYVEAVGVSTNTFVASLSVTNDSDTAAPNLQIITRPVSSASPFVFRFNAVDDLSLDVRWNGFKTNAAGAQMFNPLNTNAIQFRFRLSPTESSFGVWTNVSWARYASAPEGHVFFVQAKDAAGNVTEVSFPETQPAGQGPSGTRHFPMSIRFR
jgi:hypothetical protein